MTRVMLPCPFCGDHNGRLPGRLEVTKTLRDGYADCTTDRDAYAYAVVCSTCASRAGQGPWSKVSEQGAIDQWNGRHDGLRERAAVVKWLRAWIDGTIQNDTAYDMALAVVAGIERGEHVK